MRLTQLLLAAIFWFGFVHSTTVKPKKPSDDDFYVIPENIGTYELGAIVKWRKAPQMVRSILFPINIKNAWQYMVRSTNSQGEAIGIVGTILEPYDSDPTKVVVYSFAEDAASPNCAPSYSILFGASINTIALQLESSFMNVLLTKGWFVVIPDYEGPNAAFVAGRLAGMATLDSIKGALRTGNLTNISPSAQVALWGFSGGSIPTSWATVLQPSYAPQIRKNLVGAAFGGWVSNITRTVEFLEGGIFSGFVASGVLGLIKEYPEVQGEVLELVDPKKILRLNETVNQCLIQTLFTYPFEKFFSGNNPYFAMKWDLFNRPEVHSMLIENTITANKSVGLPQIPLFLYHGKPDEVIPFENAEEGYKNFCDWGVESFEFAVSNTSGHIVEYMEGAGAAVKWIEDRFKGKASVSGCQKTERTSNFHYPGVDQNYYEIVRTNLDGISLEPLGPSLRPNSTLSAEEISIFKWFRGMVDKIGPIPIKRDEVLDVNRLDEVFKKKINRTVSCN